MRLFHPALLALALAVACCAAPSPAAFGQTGQTGQTGQGERYTLVVRGAALGEALEVLARTTGIELAYTTERVAGKRTFCNGRGLDAEALLRCVLEGTGLDYLRSSSGAYLLIDLVARPPQYGGLVGTVLDGVTGAPLPDAHVLVNEGRRGTTTNEAGLFTLAALVTGPHRVVVTYVGYRPTMDSVWVTTGGPQRLQIQLQPQENVMKPVLIDGLAQRLPSERLEAGTLTGEAVRGGGAGPGGARPLSGLPGVTVQQPLADLHIQGGGAGEHVTLLDGVPVRDPVSLGRYLSAFSPLALGRITVHKAGFGVEQGSHLAGVVAVEHDLEAGGGSDVALTVDPLSVNGRAAGGFSLGAAGSVALMAAGRSSLWGVHQDRGIASLLHSWYALDPLIASNWIGEPVSTGTLALGYTTPDVVFSDLHAAARVRLNPFRSLDASVYRARNDLFADLAAVHQPLPGTSEQAGRLILTRDGYAWTNWVGQVRYSELVGARSALTVQAGGSWNDSRYDYYGLHTPTAPLPTVDALRAAARALEAELEAEAATSEHNHIRELELAAELNHSLSARHHLDVGLTASQVRSRFVLRSPYVAAARYDEGAFNAGAFVKGHLTLGAAGVVEPGLRLTYLPARRTVYAEPRFAVRYDRSGSRIGPYALRLAGGLYRQFVNQYELTSVGTATLVPWTLVWLPVDRSVAPPTAYHLSGALLRPGRLWSLELEGYHKWQPRLLVIDYTALHPPYGRAADGASAEVEQSTFTAVARGQAYGGSVRLRRDGDRLDLTAKYGYSHAVRRTPSRFQGRPEPVPWNEPHTLLLEADLALTPHVGIVAGWQSAWGRRWGLRRAYYDYVGVRAAPGVHHPYRLDRPSAVGVPAFHQLDAGVTGRLQAGGVDVRGRVTASNLLGRQNVYDWSLQETAEGLSTAPRLLPGRNLYFAVKLSY